MRPYFQAPFCLTSGEKRLAIVRAARARRPGGSIAYIAQGSSRIRVRRTLEGRARAVNTYPSGIEIVFSKMGSRAMRSG